MRSLETAELHVGDGMLEADGQGRSPGAETEKRLLADHDAADDNASRPGAVDFGAQFDELLEGIGNFGRYQKILIFCVLLPMTLNFASSSAWIFLIQTPDVYGCVLPVNNVSESDVKRLLPPPDSKSPSDAQRAYCSMYDVNYSALLNDHVSVEAAEYFLNNASRLGNISTTVCEEWEFERTSYHSTIVTDWNLVCGADFLSTVAYMVGCLGMLIGIPVGGYFCDHYGRKKTFFVFLFIQIVFGGAAAFSPNYWTFLILTAIQMLAVNPLYAVPFTLGLEIISPDYRATFTVFITVFLAVGDIGFIGVAYFVRAWRSIALICTFPFVIFAAYWWFLPESPRFLLTQKRYAEVENFLRRAAKWNGKEYDEKLQTKFIKLVENFEEYEEKKSMDETSFPFTELFSKPNIRRKTLLLMYLSANVTIVYCGLNYYAPSLGKDPHLSFLLSNLVELPGSLLTQTVADRLGRRLTTFACLILGGICCLATLAFPSETDHYIAVLSLFLIARMFNTTAYTVQELMVCELLPTVVRGEGVGITNMVSSIVSNLGPVIAYFQI
ncbi:beta-alanine transporter-like [Paramacrobiotus metropolitanus]|uniref:beta-alanine transporter-like n=1 Tax=Paramacrobiotus metropolitanus TaxID=2943436 RepID=UPI00244607FB|nr:beta-alanine transporter-like [Paramacrobiotus metropolitanus]XP_055351407.1 beta-alanine transporter-like [Paramacrobiotus metropolitanus]